MKNKITLTLTTILLLTTLVGCGGQSTPTDTTPTSTPEIEEPIESTGVSENSDGYYPFVKEENGYTYLTVTPQEFIENYNKVIVGKGEGGKTWDISINDFELISSPSLNGRQTSFYACPLTIFGRNNGIMITMQVFDDDNTIYAVQLGINDYYVYDSDANRDILNDFTAQYGYLIMGLGLSEKETSDILDDLEYNERNYSNYSLYKKGLGFVFNRQKDNGDIGWYRIVPTTKELAVNQNLIIGK